LCTEILLECLNDDLLLEVYNDFLHVSRHKQLDVIHVRFCSGSEVHTHYFASAFMGHATVDLMVKEEECLMKLRKCNLMQLIMGRPTGNWKMFEDLQVDMEKDRKKDAECWVM